MPNRSRIAALLVLFTGWLAMAGCNNEDDCQDCGVSADPPAIINDVAKHPDQFNDFLRLIFLFPNQPFSGRLGQPAAVYALAGPTRFYQPPLPVSQVPQYPGLTYRADKTLYAIRCQPRDSAALEPVLASWPNIYALIKTNLSGNGYACPAPPGAGENALYCLIRNYQDTPSTVSVDSIYPALEVAVQLFANPNVVNVLKNRYGIYQEFSGLGLSVKTYDNYAPMSAKVVLDHSVVPEYLVKNTTLAQGECRCIRVEPYVGRENDPLDPDFITQAGSADCPAVNSLQRAR
jgi:hypothetical protein